MRNNKYYKLLIWILLAMLFNIAIYYVKGDRAAIEFLGGYIIELSLSIDNLFLFLMIFSSFGIDEQKQERVLKYGILGAVILRLIFILIGVSIIHKFKYVLNIFGAILVISGLGMLFENDKEKDYKNSLFIRIISFIIPIWHKEEGDKFFVEKKKKVYATPLFLILLLVEFSDLIFAFDSIPAIFSITTDTLIVYSSNIFAILGLRSLYYILCGIHERFSYVKYGVSLVVIFTGVKLIALLIGVHISTVVSILIISIIMLSSILLSLLVDA